MSGLNRLYKYTTDSVNKRKVFVYIYIKFWIFKFMSDSNLISELEERAKRRRLLHRSRPIGPLGRYTTNGVSDLSFGLNLPPHYLVNGGHNSEHLYQDSGPVEIPELTEDMPTTYDVKYGFQTQDHSGWYLLDGRPVTSIVSPVARLNALGRFGADLPDHRDAYPCFPTDPATVGSLEGSNEKDITESNIPVYDLYSNFPTSFPVTGSLTIPAGGISGSIGTTDAGNHRHKWSGENSNKAGDPATSGRYEYSRHFYDNSKTGDYWTSFVNGTSYEQDAAGDHHHTVPPMPQSEKTFNVTGSASAGILTVSSRNSGSFQDSFDVRPRTINLSAFVYLL